MRALVIMIFLLGSLPITLFRPYVGVVMWYVVSFMNIQQEAYGALSSAPVGLMIAAAVIIGLVISPEAKKLPLDKIVILIFLWASWITVTSFTALLPDLSWSHWNAVIKMLMMTLVAIPIINNRQRLHGLVCAMVVCIGIYGVRGGLFTLMTGGGGRVVGPPNTMIGDNNNLALALIMILPLIRYLHLQTESRLVRLGLVGMMVVVTISVFGSYSRGALIGIAVMLVWMLRNSRNRFAIIALGLMAAAAVPLVMPKAWFDRMDTISQQANHADESVEGRFDSYKFAYREALDSVTGGGFQVYADQDQFLKLVPEAPRARAIHSIYFEALGEHGFIGLGIFVALIIACFFKAAKIRAKAREAPEWLWAFDLASMLQVSLIGYAVAGAFLPMTFYDLFYAMAAMLVMLDAMVPSPTSSQEEGRREMVERVRRHPALEAGATHQVR
jgi:probable O-glycosylation ligase (exosortase A-associated)